MGKNISPEGYMGWMTRGVRAMMGTLRSWVNRYHLDRCNLPTSYRHEFSVNLSLIYSLPRKRSVSYLLVSSSWTRQILQPIQGCHQSSEKNQYDSLF
jgi:hypothetical protein